MALPFLSRLSVAARTAVPAVRGAARRGLSRAQTREILRRQGLRISNEALGTVMRHERDLIAQQADFRFLAPNRRPNPDRLLDALTRIRRRYSFIVEVSGRIGDSEELVTLPVTISTDTLLTRAQLEEAAIGVVGSRADAYSITPESANITSGLKAGEPGTV